MKFTVCGRTPKLKMTSNGSGWIADCMYDSYGVGCGWRGWRVTPAEDGGSSAPERFPYHNPELPTVFPNGFPTSRFPRTVFEDMHVRLLRSRRVRRCVCGWVCVCVCVCVCRGRVVPARRFACTGCESATLAEAGGERSMRKPGYPFGAT